MLIQFHKDKMLKLIIRIAKVNIIKELHLRYDNHLQEIRLILLVCQFLCKKMIEVNLLNHLIFKFNNLELTKKNTQINF